MDGIISALINAEMGEWKNEDDIKAELRMLTAELRRLREELRDMVTPPKPNRARAFMHRQAWPRHLYPGANEPVAEAADTGRRQGLKPQKK